MGMISIHEAAQSLGVTQATVDGWIRQGWLESKPSGAPNGNGPPAERMVDADQLHDLVDSIGWLQLSYDTLDDVNNQSPQAQG